MRTCSKCGDEKKTDKGDLCRKCVGKSISDETRLKLSNSAKGRTFSEDTLKKMSEAKNGSSNVLYGTHRSPEVKQKISESNKGKHNFKFSDEVKQKMSATRKGSDNPFYGKTHTEETIHKIIKNGFFGGRKGKPPSEETKEKIRKSVSSYLKNNPSTNISKSGKLFLDELEKILGVTLEREYSIGYKFYDGRYKNILIEVDGERWHNKEKDEFKNKLAVENGYTLYRFPLNSVKDITNVIHRESDKIKSILTEIST